MDSHYDLSALDSFVSQEDIDLRKLPDHEYYAEYEAWLRLAQFTNDQDADVYSHGVFMLMREPRPEKAE